MIRHKACSLKDTAHAIFAAELDPEFDRMCEEIKEARRKRGKNIFKSVKKKVRWKILLAQTSGTGSELLIKNSFARCLNKPHWIYTIFFPLHCLHLHGEGFYNVVGSADRWEI